VRRWFPCLIGLLLGSCVAAGCGGGDSAGSSTSTGAGGGSLSKEEYVRLVDGYCAELRHQLLGPKFRAYRAQQRRQAQQGEQPRPAASFFREEVAGGMRRLIDRIRAVPPPAGDESQVNAILSAAEDAAGQIEAHAADVKGVNPPFAVELESRTIDRAKVLSREYGLKRCGGPVKDS
jgi:hypothetical protein